MALVKLYDPKKGRKMRVACFMSGSGTNAKRILERSLKPDSRYEVTLIFTDVRDNRLKRSGDKLCKAKEISEEYDIVYVYEDIRDFYRSKGHKTRRDLSLRPEFDSRVLKKIAPYEIDLIALAGYMSITTWPLLESYSGRIINVHPADLSIMENDERKYVGIHAVREAIRAGESELRSTTHIVREKVDYGEILVVSEPLSVCLPTNFVSLQEDDESLKRIVDEHQERLKERGDWVIYPLTIQMIAEGKFSLDFEGNVFYEEVKLDRGLRLDEMEWESNSS